MSTVIRHAIHALLDHPGGVSRIHLVTGRDPEPALGIDDGRLEIHTISQLDYAGGSTESPSSLREKARGLAEMLLARFASDSSIWWIHNYHLGKNPLFTEAVLHVAASGNAPRMILQPHDFPEAGRFENLAGLDNFVTLPLYPAGPRIRYALLNPRDWRILRDSGLPAEYLQVLGNPVPRLQPSEAPREGRRELRARLFPADDPELLTLLYPVRAIRRKNVLEAGLLTLLMSRPARLLVTLPGVSAAEREYSNLAGGCFASGLVRGELGIGERRPEIGLETLAQASDLIVSSSIQEGFGYLFVQSLQWGLPLLARHLDTMEGFDDMLEGYPARFYSALLVPLEAAERARLRERYAAKMASLEALLPKPLLLNLQADLSEMLAKSLVDFSYLDPQLQRVLLERAVDSQDWREAVRKANRSIIEHIDDLLLDMPRPQTMKVDGLFGPAAYTQRLHRLLDSFRQPGHTSVAADPAAIQLAVRNSFATREHMRFLYD